MPIPSRHPRHRELAFSLTTAVAWHAHPSQRALTPLAPFKQVVN